MAKATKQKLNQVQALQQLLQPGKKFTREQLRDRVSKMTGRTISENSLNVAVCKVRSTGVAVKANKNKNGERGYAVVAAETATA